MSDQRYGSVSAAAVDGGCGGRWDGRSLDDVEGGLLTVEGLFIRPCIGVSRAGVDERGPYCGVVGPRCGWRWHFFCRGCHASFFHRNAPGLFSALYTMFGDEEQTGGMEQVKQLALTKY